MWSDAPAGPGVTAEPVEPEDAAMPVGVPLAAPVAAPEMASKGIVAAGVEPSAGTSDWENARDAKAVNVRAKKLKYTQCVVRSLPIATHNRILPTAA